MNNKGFGLPEVLAFIGISLFTLVAISIYCKSKFGNEIKISPNNDFYSNINLTPANLTSDNKYNKLEEKMVETAKKYNFDKKENIILSLNKLNLKINDPYDNDIICNGYVVYKSDNNEYIPYLLCEGMYASENYNKDFE